MEFLGAHSEFCTHIYCAAHKLPWYRWPLTGASSWTGLHGGICQCCRHVCCELMWRSFCIARTPEKSSLHGPYHLLALVRRLHFRVEGAFLVCFRKDCPCILFVLSSVCLIRKHFYICISGMYASQYILSNILSKFSGCIA